MPNKCSEQSYTPELHHAARCIQDLGRRDDLESWFYMTVEMTRGTLPWRLVTGSVRPKDSTSKAENQRFFRDNIQSRIVFLQIAMQFVPRSRRLALLGALSSSSKRRNSTTRF